MKIKVTIPNAVKAGLSFKVPDSLSANMQGAITRGIREVEVDENGVLTFTLTDGTVADLGRVTGESAYEIAVKYGYGGTEEEWNAAVNEARLAAEAAQRAAEAAQEAAETAKEDAETAKTDAETAQQAATYAQSAAEKAKDEASTASTAAKGYADASAKSAEDAKGYAEIAETAKANAEEAQQAAAESESAAQQAQESAAASSTSAKGYSDEAANSAEQAKGYAETAQQAKVDAETAQQSASDSQSAAERAQEGAVASSTEAKGFSESAAESATQAKGYAETALQAKVSAETAQQSAIDAKLAAESAQENAAASSTDAKGYSESATKSAVDAKGYMESAEQAKADAEAAQQSAAESKTAAEQAQEDAASSSAEAKGYSEAAAESAEQAKDYADSLDAGLMQTQINGKADNLYFDEATSLLYLMSNGEIIGDGVTVATSGGGGTGGVAEYTITLTNLLESRIFSVPAGVSTYLKFNYASVDSENYDDGAGVGTVTVNGVKKATVSVKQGENELDISGYLSSGDNAVKLTVENSEGSKRSLSYTIKAISLSISTTLEDFTVQSGDLTLYYTPVGVGEKTITFKMDGKEIGTAEVTASGRSQSYIIPAQAHGGHVLEIYASMIVDEVLIVCDPVRRGIVWAESGNMTPVVLTTFNEDTAVEGETLTIPYMVYDPTGETAAVKLEVVDYSSKDLTVGREAQSWVVQDYPAGDVTFKITCKEVSASINVTVEDSSAEIATVTDSLALDFNPAGRSNQEDTPAVWTNGNVAATFEGVGFSGADGWLTDGNGAPMLRILPGGEMTIPYQLFATDRRDTGVTVEIEMATHNVRDYDSVVLSCLSGGRGFKVASQYAQLNSEQSSIAMQFKEDDRVRITFAVEPKALNRLIYVYVDGVMCGAIQYPADDNFQQNPAAGITIGAESSGIDLYRVLLYTKGLTQVEVLDNYIAGRATLQQRLNAYNRNDILNAAEEIVISKLPATLPYMVIACAELPQFKDDKKTCAISYVNPSDTSRSFTADGVEIDVQGTSSAGYKKKNFKFKLKGGCTYTATGAVSENYQLRSTSMPATAFCMKADVASSEGANNVELVRLYNDVVPYKTAPQIADERVRVGIDGLPCVIFWQNTDTGETKFWGKYNFNDEKSSNQVFGLTEGCESWEICNNTSNRVIFKESDYGEGWNSDFEARYPDKSTDYTNLKRLTDWLVSTDRSVVTSEAEKAARLQKFKDEFEDYFIKVPTLFYYLFTEVFLMVDSRAKNLFPSTFDGVHWLPLPYDMDTALGINNEGALVFDYDLEDTDTVGGADVFNGQESVLWCNVRDAFGDEIKEMYADLRGGALFNYDTIVQRFAEHQAIWPEAVWNEDAYEKYLEPLLNDNDGAYLSMLQGSKASQREWWLYNGLRYRDSKYQTGDAQKQFITLRCYEVGDITVTPYSHIWPRIKYGSYTVTERGKRNVPTKLVNPLDKMNDTEVYIYSADRLVNIGDLSPLMVGYANFSMANKLQTLKLGDGAEGYTNTRLSELYVGNNDLLATLDVRNCPNLTQTVDLSGCAGLETIEAEGSAVTGFTLPVGGQLKEMHLPGTVTNLTLRGMKQLSDLTMEGYGSLTTLRVENTPNVPLETIINGATNLERVRLLDVEWTATDEEALTTTINRLRTCGGLSADGSNTDTAVVNGTVNVDSISGELLEDIYTDFPELVVVVDGEPVYLVRYLDYDGTVLYLTTVAAGDDVVNPVATGAIEAPTRESTGDTGYVFKDFGVLPTNVHGNTSVVAQYSTTYRVLFCNYDDTVLDTQWIIGGGTAVEPVISTPTKPATSTVKYDFAGWDRTLENITEPTVITAVYTDVYRVQFCNYDSTVLDTQWIISGGAASEPAISTPTKTATDTVKYAFAGWNRALENITAPTVIVAVYTDVYRVRFMVEGVVFNTQWVNAGDGATAPSGTPTKEATAQYRYTFSGWDGDYSNITAPTDFEAVFTATLQTYTVRFYNGTTLLQTVEDVPYGSDASYTGTTPEGGEDYEFIGWNPAPTAITGDTDCYASFLFIGVNSVKLIEGTLSGVYENTLVESIEAYGLYGLASLAEVRFPSVTVVRVAAFQGTSTLTKADFPVLTSIDGSNVFYRASLLTALILRSESVCTLGNTSAFTNTPIASGTGYIYVPSALVDTYKAATNWSTYADQIRAIEDYPEITGGAA